ncbi:LacI family transcription regulator [Asticcacaulis sp. AC460]|uniref:LacI family DNA-binding transcriptional regulator n=1 Tax=Asticcacaulis sp. AC460 TaxID=1282360 RepID=UPI0003C3CBF6|nr:LacI family DNA-binding transcriptional regulator [Asticcacaulis sp. AC460]ESQ87154.1 LacI family transcription regulator [Asticcacaulis sp. AC460]
MDNEPAKPGRRSRNAATIHDVAKHSGVSPMTVSRVINGETNVREETRQKVLASVAALNYAPSTSARALAAREDTQIAVLYTNPSTSYLNEILIGALTQTGHYGCRLTIAKCEGLDEAVETVEDLAAAGIDGFLLPAPISNSNRVALALDRVNLPSVGIAAAQQPPGRTTIAVDDHAAAFAMTTRLVELGHTRIGFIKGHPNNRASDFRTEGFYAAMNAAGLDVDVDLVVQGYFDYHSGFDAAAVLLGRPDRPTAIFASNDDMAAGVLANAHSFGVHVPAELTVVGFDDTTTATTVWPELTTVRQPTIQMASQAVDLLLLQIRAKRTGATFEPRREVRDFEIIERQTSAPAPKV